MDIKPSLKLHNTLGREVEKFVPIKTDDVRVYTCGQTVYENATIGNFRTYIFEDILKRVLRYDGYKTTFVQNITDVGHLTGDRDMGEDKLEKSARTKQIDVWKLARSLEADFFKDSHKLNILDPDISCRATEHIPEQIAAIKKLEERGFTYKTNDGIYFDTSKLPDYGKLANLDIEGLREGARVEVNPEKKNLTDFVLWKFSPKEVKRQMEWESPWGIGFPGWHIECTAMSIKYLSEPFDIHCGGIDHIPVHHTNEIAQNEAIYGHKTVNYWLHGGFLLIDGGKMSKSLNNFYTVTNLEDKGFDPLVFRYFTFTSHYRQPLNFTWDALTQSKTAYNKLVERIAKDLSEKGKINTEWNEKFLDAINDDLNMPKAMAVVWEMLKSDIPSGDKVATIEKFDEVLGLSILDKAKTAQADSSGGGNEIVDRLVEARNAARANKDWAASDKLRKDIEALGYKVEDAGGETKVYKI